MPSPSASQVNLTYKISTSGLTSTVHTHAEFPGPHLRGALDTLMIFSAIGDAMHTATMKGTASVTYEGKNAILDVHATQTGYLISSTCPLMLPPSKMETLKPSHLPALDALQKLAKQLQAEDPHPNSP
ncbi:hypothetical protein Thpro_021671 [Acidihalobacter prosperus]|uniref:Uncharacterized protein n=2 Tax=Acidihalobacter prosperus TaxID=160660 RepID=A0A1A6C454_9GAMM|nr:hypothetical protein Thpro_021671 [Acidihalobacter prosperus]